MENAPEPECAAVLVVAWGKRYIDRMARYALGSLLAPGNLPYVARRLPVTLLIMTRASDAEFIQSLPNMKRLGEFASIRIIPVDDLIVPGLYTVTLTLAYARGMAAFGDNMTRTVFFSLNADFVLSDGSLAHVLQRIERGAACVMAASYKAIAEDVLPEIERHAKAGDGIIAVSGRELAEIGLRAPHLTTVAKTANQTRCWSKAANHIFWQVDKTASVARFFQIFFLGLRPTRAVTQVHGYCDYSFPELYCPDGAMDVIGDSDDVMILEMQDRGADADSVVFGQRPAGVWEANISEWIVPSHLQAARTPMLFHSGDRDETCDELIELSNQDTKQLLSALGPPVPNRGHYYWVAGVAAWFMRRPTQEDPPPELDRTLRLVDLANPSFEPGRAARRFGSSPKRRGLFAGAASSLRQRLWGVTPRLGPLNIGRDSYQPVLAAVESLRRLVDTGGRILIVAPIGTWLDGVFASNEPRITWIEPEHLIWWKLADTEKVDAVLVKCSYPDSINPQLAAENVRAILKPGGALVYVAHKPIWIPDAAWLNARLVDALLIESTMQSQAATIEIGRQPEGMRQRELDRITRAGAKTIRALRYGVLLALYAGRRLSRRRAGAEAEPTSVVVRIVSTAAVAR